jgi:hypothetical protein
MSEQDLIAVAKEEMKEWHTLPTGLTLAILWAFIYRVTRGRSIEQDFFPPTMKSRMRNFDPMI